VAHLDTSGANARRHLREDDEFDRRDREYRIIDSWPARLIAPASYASNVFR
jgi:hypothetical protein